MQNKIGEEFKSIQPDYTNFEMVETSTAGAVYAGGGGLFASDRRANAVGDIITITLEESMTAANSGSETTSKSDNYAFDLPEALFGPSSFIGKLFFKDGINEQNLQGGTTQSFTGTGSAAQANSISGTLSVTVVRVFPNGNLEIKGQKKLRITEGTEYIRLSGIIRPQDISTTNSVSSAKIAEAQIEYVGAGILDSATKPGWGSSIFRAISPF